MPPSFVSEAIGSGAISASISDRPKELVAPRPARQRQRLPSKRSVQRTQWKQQSSVLQQAAGLALVVGVAGVAFAAWLQVRKWLDRRHSREQAGPTSTSKGGKGKGSSFKFDRKKPAGGQQQQELSAIQAIPMRSMPTNNTTQSSKPRPSGNAKKSKGVKNSRKEAKQAKEQESRANDEVASIIAARAKAKGIADAGKTPDTGLVTVTDFERTADAFHHVAQWQETGKKNFK